MSSLVSNFLATRQLIDRNATTPGEGKGKEVRNVMEKPKPEMDNVAAIIEAKPSKKVVMDFLKRKVAQYTDVSSDDD
jgi:hypothetical protein